MKKIYFGNLKPKRGKIHIAKDMCKGCGFCVEYCPEDVLELSAEFNVKGYHPPDVKHEDKCLYCQLCETICPEFAIFVTQKTPGEEEPSLSEAETSGTTGEAHKQGGNR
jgi:2-oxoglutarate ferredoxin oxidoreductase subunit delta